MAELLIDVCVEELASFWLRVYPPDSVMPANGVREMVIPSVITCNRSPVSSRVSVSLSVYWTAYGPRLVV